MKSSRLLKKTLVHLTESFKGITGLKAISLCGSYANNYADSKSDIDVNLLYYGSSPIQVGEIKKIIKSIGQYNDPLISNIDEWNPFINGGAKFVYEDSFVDLYYFDIDVLENTIRNCNEGQFSAESVNIGRYLPFGYYDFYSLGIVKNMISLYDPYHIIKALKHKIIKFHSSYKKEMINFFLLDAENTLRHAHKAKTRNNVHIFSGSVIHLMGDLIKVIYALNEEYMLSEKHYEKDFSSFKIKPLNFNGRYRFLLSALVANPKLSYVIASTLFKEVSMLCKKYYTPIYFNNELKVSGNNPNS